MLNLPRINIHTFPLDLESDAVREFIYSGEKILADMKAGRIVGISSLLLYHDGRLNYRARGVLLTNPELRAHVAQVVATHFNR